MTFKFWTTLTSTSVKDYVTLRFQVKLKVHLTFFKFVGGQVFKRFLNS